MKWKTIIDFVIFKKIIKFRMWPFSKYRTPKFQIWIEHRDKGKIIGSHLLYKTKF